MKESLQVSMENVEYESRVNFHGDLKKDESDAEASTTRGSRSVEQVRGSQSIKQVLGGKSVKHTCGRGSVE